MFAFLVVPLVCLGSRGMSTWPVGCCRCGGCGRWGTGASSACSSLSVCGWSSSCMPSVWPPSACSGRWRWGRSLRCACRWAEWWGSASLSGSSRCCTSASRSSSTSPSPSPSPSTVHSPSGLSSPWLRCSSSPTGACCSGQCLLGPIRSTTPALLVSCSSVWLFSWYAALVIAFLPLPRLVVTRKVSAAVSGAGEV